MASAASLRARQSGVKRQTTMYRRRPVRRYRRRPAYIRKPRRTIKRKLRRPQNRHATVTVSLEDTDITVNAGGGFQVINYQNNINDIRSVNPFCANMMSSYQDYKVNRVQIELRPMITTFDGVCVGTTAGPYAHVRPRIATKPFKQVDEPSPTTFANLTDWGGAKEHSPVKVIRRVFKPYCEVPYDTGATSFAERPMTWCLTSHGNQPEFFFGSVMIEPPDVASPSGGPCQIWKVILKYEILFKRAKF